MTEKIKIEIDARQIHALAANLTEKSAQDAWRRTLRKLGVWFKGQAAKAVSKEARIAQKVVRQRIYFFPRSWSEGKVWLGMNPFKPNRLGTMHTTSKGITAGRHRFPGAWVMKNIAPKGPIFERTSKERKPYREIKYEWEEAGNRAFREAAKRAEARLLEILRQEINYEIHKAIGNAK